VDWLTANPDATAADIAALATVGLDETIAGGAASA
jgi:hypothetical protein